MPRKSTASGEEPEIVDFGKPLPKTAEERSTHVAEWAGLGLSDARIARMLGVSMGEFRSQYARELCIGKHNAEVAVRKSLFDQATVGRVTTATIFLAKAQCKMDDRPVQRKNLKTQVPNLISVEVDEGAKR